MKKQSLLCFKSGILLLACLGLLGCNKPSGSPPFKTLTLSQHDLVESNNLFHIWLLLREGMGESDHFQSNLADFSFPQTNANLFVSPETANKPGDIKTIADWTDYIYIGNNTEQIPLAALVVSPPENYDGKYGIVLCVAGTIIKLPPEEIKAVLNKPWILDRTASTNNVEYMKQRIKINVPSKMRNQYPLQQ